VPVTVQSTTIPSAVDRMKLITEGRLTTIPHIVEVRFVVLDGSFFVLAGDQRSDWVLNALRTGKARVRAGDWIYEVAVRRASESQKKKTFEAFTSKYGGKVVQDWYSKAGACLCLRPERPPVQRGTIKGEGDATTTYQEWLRQGSEYYGGIAEAFDSASEEYDFTIRRNYINTWIRQRSIEELLNFAKPRDTLLEVGCGTGAEAIEISKHVSKIIATDISDKMIGLVKKKVQARGLSRKIVLLQARAADIGRVRETEGQVDLAYCFNGALNCEPDLDRFANGLSTVLVPGGYFVCSIRNSFCLGEALSHAAVLQFEKMAPRKKQPVMVSVGGMDIPAFYYSPAAFSNFFSTKFKLKRMIALPAFLPPAYLSDYYVKFKRITSVLERFEPILGGHFPFNRVGDQTLFVFQSQ
jgi:ubiquinone/menaquinone biosynthesis C-methylase UbiE